MKFSAVVIVVSDRAAAGVRPDETIPVFESLLDGHGFELVDKFIVADEQKQIETALQQAISNNTQLILTSGGTGCGPRDITPEVTRNLLKRPTPGLDEAIRAYSLQKSPYAMFSRAVSGVADKSLIVNLPGSPKAVREILEYILPLVKHPLKLIAGELKDCQEDLTCNDKPE